MLWSVFVEPECISLMEVRDNEKKSKFTEFGMTVSIGRNFLHEGKIYILFSIITTFVEF